MQIGPGVSPEYKTSQTTDRRHAVPKARPIVRSAKKLNPYALPIDLRALFTLLQPRSSESVESMLQKLQRTTDAVASDAEFQKLEIPQMPFLPQQYRLQSGLVVNVHNMRKDEDRMVLKLFADTTERGEGYTLYEYPNLEDLRRDLSKGHWCVFEEVGSGKLVGCCVINASRRMRTNVASCSESELVLNKAFQV